MLLLVDPGTKMLQPLHLSSIASTIRLDLTHSLQNASTNVHHFISSLLSKQISKHPHRFLTKIHTRVFITVKYHMENIDRNIDIEASL